MESSATPIIGLEVHVQLLTRTKIFCGCVNRFNPDEPNTQTCPVCLGLPGALPVLNGEALRLSIMTALALNCEIAPFTKWDRKQYYYPDLPKGYQISQYDLPFSHDGWVDIEGADPQRRIRIRRAHLEEDAGKNIHDESGRGADSRVDLNRAGTPLLEIVTEPDLTSAADAKTFLEELHLMLTYLGVSDCNMQEGSLRCDANVNVKIGSGDEAVATPIVEIKNLNSFRAVEAAILFECERQQKEFAKTGLRFGDPGAGKSTRGWDADRNVSFPQREKEEESDYRYFPDPDLVPVTISDAQVASVRDAMCELPAVLRQRFVDSGLSVYDASVIVNQGANLATYYEAVAEHCGDAKQAANWVTQDVQRILNERHIGVEEFPIPAAVLGALIRRVIDGVITVRSGREVFAELLDREDGASAETIDEIIDAGGLRIVNDSGALQSAIDAAIAESPQAVEDLRAGKPQAVGPLIGKVMRQVKGADAQVVRSLLLERVQSADAD